MTIAEVPSSITSPIHNPAVGQQEVRRAFDEMMHILSSSTNNSSADKIYKFAQMYGKNVTVDSLMSTLEESIKVNASIDSAASITLIFKTIRNQFDLLQAQKCELSKNAIISLILGYALSAFSENLK